jgi:hypothetical protein
MKLPKLIGNLLPSAAVGESKVRALQQIGSPYLTSAGPGFVARVQGAFSSVETLGEVVRPKEGPYLWVMSSWLPFSTAVAVVDPKKPALTRRLTVTPANPASEYAGGTARFVGAQRIATIEWVDAPGVGPLPMAQNATLMTQRSAVDDQPNTAGKAWVYASLAPTPCTALFATGWDQAATNYGWGYSAKPPVYDPNMGVWDDVSPYDGRAYLFTPQWATTPVVVLGGEAVVELPHEDTARAHYGGVVFCAGPGRLVALVLVADKLTSQTDEYGTRVIDPNTSRVWPYIALSTDHGHTWARADASFMRDALFKVYIRRDQSSSSAGVVEVMRLSQLRAMGSYSFFIYMGAGKTLFVLRYAVNPSTDTKYSERAYCYLYDGVSFSRVNWGFDALTDDVPYTLGSIDLPVAGGFNYAFMDMRRNASYSYCFGAGCVAIPTDSSSTPYVHRLRITRDFGTTWQVVTPSIHVSWFITVTPYRSATSPGKILVLVTYIVGGAAITRCYQTDGNFLAFTLLGDVTDSGLAASAGIVVSPRSHVYPELPGEFGKP